MKRTGVLCAVLLTASVVLAFSARPQRIPLLRPFDTFPVVIGEWHALPDVRRADTRDIPGADAYVRRTYVTNAGNRSNVYVAYWERHDPDDAVHSPLNVLPSSGWEPVSGRALRIRTTASQSSTSSVELRRSVIRKGDNRELALSWYQSRGRVIAGNYRGRFQLVTDAARSGRSEVAFVRILTPVKDSTAAAESEAERVAREFAEQLFSALAEYVPTR